MSCSIGFALCLLRRYSRATLIFALVVSISLENAVAQELQRADGPLELRMLSYNIHHAEDTTGKINLAKIATVIREAKADIVALQEVDRNVPRSGNVDQLAELMKALDMHGIFGRNIGLEGGEYGNAILSRWAIVHSENHRLPNVRDGEQRGLLEAYIGMPGDRQLRVFATHFDHRADEEERLQSAAFVNEQRLKVSSSELPYVTILAGDINARPESETLRVLLEKWQMGDHKLAPTIPSDGPRFKIDYIFAERQQPRIKVVAATVLNEPIASDHRPLLCVFSVD